MEVYIVERLGFTAGRQASGEVRHAASSELQALEFCDEHIEELSDSECYVIYPRSLDSTSDEPRRRVFIDANRSTFDSAPLHLIDISDSQAELLQQDLEEVFDRHGCQVGVGLTRDGVAIRSQDERVDASNVGPIAAWGQPHPISG